MAGVYLHIPYCRQACTYCDFHFSTSQRTRQEMIPAMVQEMERRAGFFEAGMPMDSWYFGGGTPSLLEPEELQTLLSCLARLYPHREGAEITLEANPDDMTAGRMEAWRGLGINRLSVGVQTFDGALLHLLNRAHDATQALEAIPRARAAGFTALSLDLMYGLPGTTLTDWQATLEQALRLEVPHISAYALTREPSTLLDRQVQKGTVHLPPDEACTAQFYALCERLEAAGYRHYELSNFALPGHEAVHNASYWAGSPYLGVGPGAHGYDGQRRYWNVANNARYLRSVAAGGTGEDGAETLTRRDRINEALMTRLRLDTGLDLDWLRRTYDFDLLRVEGERIALYVQEGWALLTNAHLRLTRAGKMVSDRILSELFVTESDA